MSKQQWPYGHNNSGAMEKLFVLQGGTQQLQQQQLPPPPPTPPLPPSSLPASCLSRELSGKRVFFYYHPPGARRDRQCEAGVQLCGGIVEPFFSNQVDCVVTNADLASKLSRAHRAPTGGCSSRGLLLQRLAATPDAGSADDTLAKARALGLAVHQLAAVRDCLRSSGHLPPEPAAAAAAAAAPTPPTSNASELPQFYAGDRVLTLPAIVVADPRRQRGPIVCDRLDVANYFNTGPDGKENRPKKIVSPSRARRRPPGQQQQQPPQQQQQRRRCENCLGSYVDFNSHVTGLRHRQFVSTSANFARIDKILSSVPPLAEALAAASSSTTASQPASQTPAAGVESTTVGNNSEASARLIANLNWLAASPRGVVGAKQVAAASAAARRRRARSQQEVAFLTPCSRRNSADVAGAKKQQQQKLQRKSAPQLFAVPAAPQKPVNTAAAASNSSNKASNSMSLPVRQEDQQPSAKRPRLDIEESEKPALQSEVTECMALSSFGRLSRSGGCPSASGVTHSVNDETVPMSDQAWSDATDPLQSRLSASSAAGPSVANRTPSDEINSRDCSDSSVPFHRRHKRPS